ncbi:OmpA family protein [Neorhizobium sp. P12A]|jgi:outer membrane protein OmpA-like peptidoglycan-associated protein|uniref:OmpA family protein n=1 Tax=Rhizobium/Agrobacterium group TaxID=227290 RepID=UPI0010454D1F|nr:MULTISPECIES: OmpA family protein [Rhizobium/Agrobacterium group]KAA0700634.1 OmpA family protein [Neorhizobium sp. P12A]TCR91973.1 outer membrane protein OmpA-like peptidoglycan-associated protein [Rhizobium sp. BK376]
MRQRFFKTFAVLVALGILPAGLSFAQQVSQERIISGLGKLKAAAPSVDIELLRQEAISGAGKDMSALPNWSKIAKLPQMVVEINFENDSVAIQPKSYRTLGMIADALHHPNLWAYKFLVIGHASSTGDEKHNLDLSQQRAIAIKEALATTFAVDPQRLYAVGVGEAFPIEGVSTDASNNRRVQLVNLGVFTSKK